MGVVVIGFHQLRVIMKYNVGRGLAPADRKHCRTRLLLGEFVTPYRRRGQAPALRYHFKLWF